MSDKLFYSRIDNIEDIPGADRIKKATVMGFDVVVGSDQQVGNKGYLYLPDSVLTHEAREKFGEDIFNYVGKNRRVRAITLRDTYSLGMFVHDQGVQDDIVGLAVPRELMLYRDYKSPEERKMNGSKNKTRGRKQKDLPEFPQHFDTQQYLANKKLLQAASATSGAVTSITLKMHGTSQRVGKLLLPVEYKWWQLPVKLYRSVFNPEANKSWQTVAGSRRVIFNGLGGGYHAQEFRDRVTDTIEPLIHNGEVWYFEVVGWESDDRKIMPGDYTYGTKQGQFHIYVYRITKDGVDYNNSQLEELVLNSEGKVSAVPTLAEFDSVMPEDAPEEWLQHVESAAFADMNGGHMQEGICIRVDIPGEKQPLIQKYKSKAFLVAECGHNPD